jgi:tRNA-splicing ligase RtcB
MRFALAYAHENRRRMMLVFKELFHDAADGAGFLREVNIHHNYAAKEEHFGRVFYVHRKGATSAKAGEAGIIPGSMGSASHITRGLGNPDSYMSCSHGAGRVMSRTAACQKLTAAECDAALEGVVYDRWKPCEKRHRKGAASLDLSEAPQAYKAIDAVMDAQRDLVESVVRLQPLAVLKG